MRGWQANVKTHLWVASSIRAMPENEIPPAKRVDIYCSMMILIVLKRKALEKLKKWKENQENKSLIVSGARPVIMGSVIG